MSREAVPQYGGPRGGTLPDLPHAGKKRGPAQRATVRASVVQTTFLRSVSAAWRASCVAWLPSGFPC